VNFLPFILIFFLLVFTSSFAAGAALPTKNISNSEGFSADPQVAVSDDSVYIVWEDFNPRNWEVFFRASDDRGVTFGEIVNLSSNDGESSRPHMAVSGDHVYVVWDDYSKEDGLDIFLRTSDDRGVTFNEIIVISSNAGNSSDPRRLDPPRISVFDDNVYIIWVADNEVFFRASYDRGETFTDSIRLSNSQADPTTPRRSDLPRVAASAENVYVVWVDYFFGDYDIYFRASNDTGITFGNALNLNLFTGLEDLPRLAVSGDYVYVVWDDFTEVNGLTIFFTKSSDRGTTFSTPVSLGRNVGYSLSPHIDVSGESVYIISSVGNVDVFLRKSDDNGSTFSNTVNLSNNDGGSTDPHMVISGGQVFVVWEDYMLGNPEIFFRSVPSDDFIREAMMLTTENGSVNVEVSIDHDVLEIGQPTRFMLRFLDPLTGEQLQNVNYSFTIMKDEIIVSRQNLYSADGMDIQSVTFTDGGSFTLQVEVAGVGFEEPYNTKYSGAASTTLNVVPEFPTMLGVMAAAIAAGMMASGRLKHTK
jgi:hypothetical protein